MSEKYFDTIHQNHLKVILFNWTPEMEIWQENPHLHPTINTKTAHIIRPSGIKQAPELASLWEVNAMFLETCSYHTSIISTEGRLSVSPQYTCPTGKAVAFSRVAGFAFWLNRERERESPSTLSSEWSSQWWWWRRSIWRWQWWWRRQFKIKCLEALYSL